MKRIAITLLLALVLAGCKVRIGEQYEPPGIIIDKKISRASFYEAHIITVQDANGTTAERTVSAEAWEAARTGDAWPPR